MATPVELRSTRLLRPAALQAKMATRTVEISEDVFQVAKRAAAIDRVDVKTLLESVVRSRVESTPSVTCRPTWPSLASTTTRASSGE